VVVGFDRDITFAKLRQATLLIRSGVPFIATNPDRTLPVPEGLSLHQAAGLWLWGSLAAALLLFLPPAALLGCIGPLAVEILQVRRGVHAGTAGGLVLCASTLGSLVGTFATTHVLLPFVGLTASFVGSGLALAACGVGAWIVGRPGKLATAALVVGALAAVPAARLERPALPEGMTLLEAAESPYQSLRVVEDSTPVLIQPTELGLNAPSGHFTRIHMRYRPEQVDQDLVFYFKGPAENGQMRYVEYKRELEFLFPLCGEGYADDPGECGDDWDTDPGPRMSCASAMPPVFSGAAFLLLLFLLRRRR